MESQPGVGLLNGSESVAINHTFADSDPHRESLSTSERESMEASLRRSAAPLSSVPGTGRQDAFHRGPLHIIDEADILSSDISKIMVPCG